MARALPPVARLRRRTARRQPDPVRQSGHGNDQWSGRRPRQPRFAQARRRSQGRRAGPRRGARAVRREWTAADRRSAGPRPVRAPREQLPCLRHTAVLAEPAAGRRPASERMDSGTLITEDAAEFRAALPDGGALLGLDLGTQTIGTAFCDARWSFATAGKTLPRGKFA